jgi:hypothetical protein
MSDDPLDGWDPFDPLQDQFEKTMGAMGRIDHALSLLLNYDHDTEKTRATIVRRQQNKLLLAKARDEVILKPLVEAQATFVAVTLRQMILAFPLKAARKMVGLPDEKVAKRMLDKIAHDLCKELVSFPQKITDPGWLEKPAREKA